MTKRIRIGRKMAGAALAAFLAAGLAPTAHAPAAAQTISGKPANEIDLSVGAGRMIRLDSAMSDFFIANPAIADVQIRSANQLYIFGKGAGETTVFATNATGKVIYSATVRVGNNIDSVGQMLSVAMPQSQIQVTPMNGMILLTGTVSNPADVEDAERLVQAFVGSGTQVMSRLKTATPLQVMLKVTIAEVSRSVLKNVGTNITSRDPGGSNGIGGIIGRGGQVGTFTPGEPFKFTRPEGTSAAGLLFSALGLDIAAQVTANETSGLATILAEPTLAALSGETASFLAGGQFPIPVSNGLSGTTIEYKNYGVSLSFSPTVLEDGRISMRISPEVSDISANQSVTLNGFEIPAIITRRTETTVELGSGQSFMISGLLQNNANNSVERTPFLGNLPVLGALFRSNGFRRNQTELVIVVTPYLVKPVNAAKIALPTDGFQNANDAERLLLDKMQGSGNPRPRPIPTMAPSQTIAPGLHIGAVRQPARPAGVAAAAPKPGFGF